MDIQFTTQIFKEGRTYVAHTRELDVSSCGSTEAKAVANLKLAVRLFLEEAETMGTLDQILEGPRFANIRQVSMPLPLAAYAFFASYEPRATT